MVEVPPEFQKQFKEVEGGFWERIKNPQEEALCRAGHLIRVHFNLLSAQDRLQFELPSGEERKSLEGLAANLILTPVSEKEMEGAFRLWAKEHQRHLPEMFISLLIHDILGEKSSIAIARQKEELAQDELDALAENKKRGEAKKN